MKKIRLLPSIKASPKVYITKLLNRQWLSKIAFEIELTRPLSFEFIPGQCICLFHETVERYYSLMCATKDPTLKLCIHYVKNGIMSPLLSSAKIGTSFKFTGPHGYFTFKPSPRPPVFIASGSGIAPFFSMSQSGITGFTMLHEIKTAEELYCASFFRRSAKLYIPCLSEISSESHLPPDTFLGSASEYLKKHLSPMPYDFYLCGRREMVRDVTLLVDMVFCGSFVFTEVFY